MNGNLKYINIEKKIVDEAKSDSETKIMVTSFILLSDDDCVYEYTYETGNNKFTKKCLCMRERDRNQRDEKTLSHELGPNSNKKYEIYMSYGKDFKERVSIRYFNENNNILDNIIKKESKSVVCSSNTNEAGRNTLIKKLESYIVTKDKFKKINDPKLLELTKGAIKINHLCSLYFLICLIERITYNLNTKYIREAGKEDAEADAGKEDTEAEAEAEAGKEEVVEENERVTIYYPNELLYK